MAKINARYEFVASHSNYYIYAYVMTEDGEYMVGSIAGSVMDDAHLLICSYGVDIEYRDKGIGSELLKRFYNFARSKKQNVLIVTKSEQGYSRLDLERMLKRHDFVYGYYSGWRCWRKDYK